MRRGPGSFLQGAGIVLASVFVGFLLLLLVQLIPAETIEKHAVQAGPVFAEEAREPEASVLAKLPDWNESHPNVYPGWMLPWCNAYLDNFTDALMLLTAADTQEKGLVQEAVLAERRMVEGSSTTRSLIQMAEAQDSAALSYVTEAYPRYWHGYLVLLKPLLALTDYTGVRIFLGVAETLLLAATLWVLVRRGRKNLIPLFVLLWLMAFPALMARSMQYSWIYLVFSAGNLIILTCYDRLRKGRGLVFVFLGLGIATAYFDLLTYPVAALGIPLITVFLCGEPASRKEEWKTLFRLSLAFALGYAGMWAGKWVLTYLLCGPEIFASVKETIAFRTSHSGKEGESISLISMYIRNLGGFALNPGVAAALLYFAGLLILKIKKGQRAFYCPLALGLCALMPFVWFLVTANHAYIHSYYTCRSFLVTGLALLTMVQNAKAGPSRLTAR